jgi:hypothetical protein
MARRACGRGIEKQARNIGTGGRDEGMMKFRVSVLTVNGQYVKYDYQIMQGD